MSVRGGMGSFFFAHGRSPLVVVQSVEVLEWPSRRPDLNPIEHIWDQVGRRVRQHVNPPQTLGDLERALVEQWRRMESLDCLICTKFMLLCQNRNI